MKAHIDFYRAPGFYLAKCSPHCILDFLAFVFQFSWDSSAVWCINYHRVLLCPATFSMSIGCCSLPLSLSPALSCSASVAAWDANIEVLPTERTAATTAEQLIIDSSVDLVAAGLLRLRLWYEYFVHLPSSFFFHLLSAFCMSLFVAACCLLFTLPLLVIIMTWRTTKGATAVTWWNIIIVIIIIIVPVDGAGLASVAPVWLYKGVSGKAKKAKVIRWIHSNVGHVNEHREQWAHNLKYFKTCWTVEQKIICQAIAQRSILRLNSDTSASGLARVQAVELKCSVHCK